MSDFDHRLADYASRAGRSGGRMCLHLMHVADGGGTEYWLYPLRTSTCQLSAEVELIATGTRPVGAGAVEEGDGARIQRLVDLDITEIHI